MRGQRFRKKVFYAATALFLLACALPSFLASPTQAPQALAPEQLGMAIEQTADAAKTQTVTYLPPTLTPTVTRFPTSTSVALSSTPTFLYLLPTFTPLPTWIWQWVTLREKRLTELATYFFWFHIPVTSSSFITLSILISAIS